MVRLQNWVLPLPARIWVRGPLRVTVPAVALMAPSLFRLPCKSRLPPTCVRLAPAPIVRPLATALLLAITGYGDERVGTMASTPAPMPSAPLVGTPFDQLPGVNQSVVPVPFGLPSHVVVVAAGCAFTPGREAVFVSILMAPARERPRPVSVAPLIILIAPSTNSVPCITDFCPKVTSPPICQYTLLAEAPFFITTAEFAPVVKAPVTRRKNFAFASLFPSRISVPARVVAPPTL